MGFAHIFTSHPVLHRLSPEQLETLCKASREVTYARHQPIHREGVMPAGLHLVIDGFVKLLRIDHGRELMVGLAGPNDLFGLCCQPISPTAAGCTAQARTKTKLITIPVATWQGLLERRPDVAHIVMQALMDSRSRCINLSADLVFLRLEARLAKLLVGLTRWSRPSGDGTIEIPKILSQWELAAALGSARVVITRKIQSLVDAGLLTRRGRAIVVKNLDGLREYYQHA